MKVHINQLPLKRNYIVLNENFYDNLLDRLLRTTGSIANAGRLTGIPKSVLGRYLRREVKRIRIDFLLKIMRLLDIPLEQAENNIIWIGNNQSLGIVNPKLPFDFNTRATARFLAAICNDGCITVGYRKGPRFSYGRLMYNNNEKCLRESVIRDAESIFGANICKEFHKRNEYYLAFLSIVRDVIEVVTDFKGKKSENNPSVPPFILENVELICGWIEQTIADEGHINFIPQKYRREIHWRRSFDKNLSECKLIEDEIRMLEKIGIMPDVKNIGTYKTKEGKEKKRFQMRIAKRENVCKLRKLVKIPDIKKDKTFTEMVNNFMRYKEPLIIRDAIIKICKNIGYVTSLKLGKEMNYKRKYQGYKWLKLYTRQGLLKCIQKSYYGGGVGRIPAKYVLSEP